MIQQRRRPAAQRRHPRPPQQAGELARGVTVGGADFAASDRVVFLRNDHFGLAVANLAPARVAGVKNGTLGTVEAAAAAARASARSSPTCLPQHRVLMLLDEIAQLGHLQPVEQALTLPPRPASASGCWARTSPSSAPPTAR